MVAELEMERANEILDRNLDRLEKISGCRFLRENLVRFTEDGQDDRRGRAKAILRKAQNPVETFGEVAMTSDDERVSGPSDVGSVD